jgi:hypothetical protein
VTHNDKNTAKRRANGQQKESTDKSNAIYAPIYAARMKEGRNEAAASWHNEHANVPALTEEEVKLKSDEIIDSARLGVLGTLGTLVKHSALTFYVGETKQDRLEREDLRWITERGANLPDGQGYKGGRNRPVLVWSNNKTITMKQAREQLGFQSQVVYELTFLIDASRVEDEIQNRYQHLDLGRKKLWRSVAMG